MLEIDMGAEQVPLAVELATSKANRDKMSLEVRCSRCPEVWEVPSLTALALALTVSQA